jgi:hypothetical protein
MSTAINFMISSLSREAPTTVEKVVHQHLNSLHMTNLEPGNPHYFFLAAMVFPRRPLEMSASVAFSTEDG